MIKLLGLTGKKRSGKNYTATIIRKVAEPEIQVIELSFASALKKEVASFLAIDIAELEGENKEEYRTLLQWWGTDYRRNKYGDNYWIDRMDEAVQRIKQPSWLQWAKELFGSKPKNIVIVITDVRFPNEAEYVINNGGCLWHVVNPDQTEDANSLHASETAMDKYPHYPTTLINKRDNEIPYTIRIKEMLHFYGFLDY